MKKITKKYNHDVRNFETAETPLPLNMERDMCPIGLSPASGTRLLVHVSQETWGAPVSLTITFQYQNSSDPTLSIHSCKYKPSKTSC